MHGKTANGLLKCENIVKQTLTAINCINTDYFGDDTLTEILENTTM